MTRKFISPTGQPMNLDSPAKLKVAVQALCMADDRMAELVVRVGPCGLAPWKRPVFDALVGAIVSQQLSTRVAGTIRQRLLDICGEATGESAGEVRPEALLALPVDALRSIGLSGAKTRAIKELAEHHKANPTFWNTLPHMEDEALERALCELRGVGPWTAHMVMMFSLGRRDVWPVGDLGIRKAMQRWLGTPDLPEPDQLHEPARRWQPYRTVAAWYLWRSLDMDPVA